MAAVTICSDFWSLRKVSHGFHCFPHLKRQDEVGPSCGAEGTAGNGAEPGSGIPGDLTWEGLATRDQRPGWPGDFELDLDVMGTRELACEV